MYIPKESIPLDKVELPQIRLGIQGFFKTGKTWSALTFPNPIVANLDRGLGAHRGKSDVRELPFYDPDFCKKFNPKHTKLSHLKDTIIQWLTTEGMKLEKDQTFVMDGGTGLQNAYSQWMQENPIYTKNGQIDDFAPWRLKIQFFGEICSIFKSMKCNVVYICHEAEKKEKSGEYLGKIRPLLTGQFCDELGSHFTDWFRQLAINKPDKEADIEKLAKARELSVADMKLELSTFPRGTAYYWQTESDDIFDGGCSSLVNFPRLIKADYQTFIKYLRPL